MKNAKVIKVKSDSLEFDNGLILTSDHFPECYETHYLSLADLTIIDFDGLKFDLTSDFFERIPGYGIALKPVIGHPIRIPGYGVNNGYYSSDLTLVLSREGQGGEKRFEKIFNITECQVIEDI